MEPSREALYFHQQLCYFVKATVEVVMKIDIDWFNSYHVTSSFQIHPTADERSRMAEEASAASSNYKQQRWH
jgi:hypothetical protein